MKFFVFVFALLGSCIVLVGCDSNNPSDDNIKNKKSTEKNQFEGASKSVESVSLREKKTGDFFSTKMLPISQLNPETNQDIYVHLTGQVVNINKKQTWAIIQDNGRAYFAFNHAGMPKIKKDYLGKKIYLRAILEHVPLSENILVNIKNNGLAPGFATDNINKAYQLNTTKAALAEGTDEQLFMKP
jgi:hypothetical protein